MYTFIDHTIKLNKDDIFSTQFDEILGFDHAHLLVTSDEIRFYSEVEFNDYMERIERRNMVDVIDLHRKIYSTLRVIGEKGELIHYMSELFIKKHGEKADIAESEYMFLNRGDHILIQVK